jgi:hypothetical protein
MPKSAKRKKIATLDLETDPFKYGRTPWPFAAGFFDGDTYHQTWGDDCVLQMMEYLASYPEPLIIYVHNGGGFDFWYLLEWISGQLFFIKSKLCRADLLERHEIRDSYKMIPIPLAAFQKEKIDYWKFEREHRNKYKKEIGYYLQKDCEYLYELVAEFIKRYGMHLTIGAAAIQQLRQFHHLPHESEKFDEKFRPWYMGGRVECFEYGEVRASAGSRWRIYDVNSMYPFVMATYKHPRGSSYAATKRLHDHKLSFARITATSNGALPLAAKGLKFPHGRNEFWACSHEIHAGIELGYLRVEKVHECYYWNQTQSFDTYIEHFAAEKIACEERGDKAGREFNKLFMNNGYGKAGQNPRNFQDCELFDSLDACRAAGYNPAQNWGSKFLGMKQAELQKWSFNNVAIAASITSGARAELMRGLANATRPIYCDTDSIICEALDRPLHPTKLGAWKLEGEADTLYIGGKKLYAAFDRGSPLLIKDREKKAAKGANLSAETIRKVALGDAFLNEIDAPLLRVGKEAQFLARNIRMTA